MAAKNSQASFWSGTQRTNEETLGEAHALALLHGDAQAAPAVHQMIAACMPSSGYAVMAYPCTYKTHYSKKNEKRRWNEGRAKYLPERFHDLARAAITHREEIEAIHRSCFPQYGKMPLPQREEAASRFRAKVRERFSETGLADTTEPTHALPATGGFGDTDEEASELTFGLERDLQAAVRASVGQLEAGLRIIDNGVETVTEAGRIDILAEDPAGTLVVIELKAATAQPQALSQLLAYVSAIADQRKKQARGLLIARDFHPRVMLASRVVQSVSLYRYGFRFTFEPMS